MNGPKIGVWLDIQGLENFGQEILIDLLKLIP